MDSISGIGGAKKSGESAPTNPNQGGTQATSSKPYMPFQDSKPAVCSSPNRTPDQVSICEQIDEDHEKMSAEKSKQQSEFMENLKKNWPFGKQE